MRIGSKSYLAAIAALLITQGAPAAAGAGDAVANVLAKSRASFGNAHGILRESGTESVSGLTGQWQSIEDTRTGWSRQASDFSLFRVSEVLNGTGDWRQDQSGGVHRLNSAFAIEHATTEMWLAKLGFLKPDYSGAAVAYDGEQSEKGTVFDVVRATPPGGQTVALWFDRKTGLLDRSVWTQPIAVDTIQYADYRRVEGFMVPFKITTTEDSFTDIVTASNASVDANASPDDFAPPVTPNDSTIEGGVATVPIEFDGQVMIEAKLNGQGPYGFILDSGGHDIVTPEVAKALHLDARGQGESGGAGEGTLSQQYARVDRVDIGGVTLRNQPFYVIPEQYSTVERGTKPPLAGIMGLELFERFAMRLDYQHRTLTFRPLQGAPEGHGTPVPIFFSDDMPLFKAKIDGIEGDNGLDTGNSGTVAIQWRWADAHGLGEGMRKGYLAAGFGSGGISKTWVNRADLNVAGVDFPKTVAFMTSDQKGAFSSRTEAGNIGDVIYSNFALDFDYARNIVWFDPQDRLPPAPPGATGLAAFKVSAAAFTIAAVAPNTPAAEAGITAGDTITSVDGVAADQMSGTDFARATRKDPGTKVTFEVVHEGKKRTVELALRNLFP